LILVLGLAGVAISPLSGDEGLWTFDNPPTNPRCGWFDQVAIDEGATPRRLSHPAPPPP